MSSGATTTSTTRGRQSVIYKAMGWEVPVFAPYPAHPRAGRAKLSKRHGATSVMEYRDMGYLPEALRNYLVPPRLEPRRR